MGELERLVTRWRVTGRAEDLFALRLACRRSGHDVDGELAPRGSIVLDSRTRLVACRTCAEVVAVRVPLEELDP